jgi:hypothetical protein
MPMIDHEAYVLREGTGTSGVVETARLAAGRLADHLIENKLPRDLAVDAAVQKFYLETWDGLKAEK